MSNKVSVAMCTYNGAHYIQEQLESIGRQSVMPDEVVVCDDRSTDDTVAIIRAYASRAAFDVKLHINEKQLGSTKNFERAVGLCSGEYIFFSDQDDVWYPEKVKRICEVLDANPRLGAVFSDADLVNGELEPLNMTMWQTVNFGKARRAKPLRDVLLQGCVVTGATMAIRSSIIPLISPIPKDWIHDGWIALLVASTSALGFVEKPLIGYRQHARNQLGAKVVNWRQKIMHVWRPSLAHAGMVALFDREFSDYSQILQRLRECQDGSRGPVPDEVLLHQSIEKLEEKIAFIAIRRRIHQNSWRGCLLALEGLMFRRYHSYTYGLQAFIGDIRPRL